MARFRELLREDFDVPGIARFVLGRYWNIATEEQRAEYVKLFEDYIAMAYATRLAEYTGETFKVTGSRPEADGAIVSSQILAPGRRRAGQSGLAPDRPQRGLQDQRRFGRWHQHGGHSAL